jgi:acetyltransferase AlgX (SGNH hydrolase-like protein)
VDFDGKVMEGSNGWLFLAHDSNDTLAQHMGRRLFSERELEEWRHLLESRRLWLADRGIDYAFLIPPNSHTIHAEQLPDHPLAETRPVTQLLDFVASVPIVYPVDELRRERGAYFQLDSHWSVLGAFIAYELLVKAVGREPMPRDDVVFEQRPVSGDLGQKIGRTRRAPRTFGSPISRTARLVHDNRVEHFGRRIELESEGAGGSCALFGDSYSYAMLPFLAETFSPLVFVQLSTVDFELVRECNPDVVLSILNERFLIEIPNDLTGWSARALEAQKIADGRQTEASLANSFAAV